jgi:hypothetical protein
MSAKAFVIKDSNGKVIGRCIPRKDSSKGVATTFFKLPEGLLVRTYGHEEWKLKQTNNSWTTETSYLTVVNVTLKDGMVKVTLLHNLNAEWNQIIEVPFTEHWRNALTIRLFEMNQKFGCETHIQNFADLCV